MGEDASTLLGSFLVTAIEIAAMSRADVPENQRRDFYLTVDEFENYATSSFATILSEARKYHLNLTIANQYLAQVEEETMSVVWGNVGSMIAFQVGVEDAEPLAAQLGGNLTPKDLLGLPKFNAYCRLLINGHPRR
jgi:type IV secretory pathway TraG/TraD family ATPase VirD4